MSELASPSPDRLPRGAAMRQRVAMLGVLGVLLAGLGIAFAVNRDNPRQAATPDESGDPTPDVEADGDAEIISVPLELAGAYDGLDSLGLPVAASPDSGLVDGQVVVIRGSGFDPNVQIGWAQCRFRTPGRGQDDCDLGNIALASTDGNGEFEAEFTVRRYVAAASGTFDCVTATLDDACGVGAGTLTDYDKSGTALFFFDPASDGDVPPRIEADQSEALVDGQELTVTGSGFEPNEYAYLTQCPVGGSNGIGSCYGDGQVGEIEVDGQGNFAVTMPARRVVQGAGGEIDCFTSPYQCLIIVQASRLANTIPLTFDGGVATPRDTEVTISPNLDLVDGQVVVVGIFDTVADDLMTIEQCVDQGPLGVSCGQAQGLSVLSGDGEADVVVFRFLTNAEGEQIDCAAPRRGCYLKIWSDGVDPIEVPIFFAEG